MCGRAVAGVEPGRSGDEMAGKDRAGKRKVPPEERFKLWVRAGGRCEICNRYLLEGQLSARELSFGEAAHIIGRTPSDRSARSRDEVLDCNEIDSADNLMLVCDDEHDELDKVGSRDAFTPAFLRAMKQRHEDRIHLATGFADYQRTTPLRLIGRLRGNPVEVSRDAAATAVMQGAGRMPRFDLSTRNAVEIDIRDLPGETEPTTGYYQTATAIIDKIIDHKVAEAVANDDIVHLSVFALARLPLLVYLGSKLDDTFPTDVYQRHRATEKWQWLDLDATASFTTVLPRPDVTKDEATLIMNVSGSIQREELPVAAQTLPLFRFTVDGIAHSDVFRGPAALAAFEAAARELLAHIESEHKHLRMLHVFAALPLSAGVSFGRVFDHDVHPAVRIYDRTTDGYEIGLEVGGR